METGKSLERFYFVSRSYQSARSANHCPMDRGGRMDMSIRGKNTVPNCESVRVVALFEKSLEKFELD